MAEPSIKILRKIMYKNSVVGYIIDTGNTQIDTRCNRKVYDMTKNTKYDYREPLSILGIGIITKREMLDIVEKALKSGLNFKFENFKYKFVYGKVSIQDDGDILTIDCEESLSALKYTIQRVLSSFPNSKNYYNLVYHQVKIFGEYLPIKYYKS